MAAFRIVATTVLAGVFLWLAAMNWYVWFLRTYRNRSTSWIPLIGGACGVLSVLIEPSGTLRAIWWLPLILDYGAAPGLIQTVFSIGRFRQRQ